jgi:hypothetical protein
MKERAIVIFELEGKSGRKKKGRGLERIDGRDGERSVLRLSFFNLRQHALIISNEKHKRKKGINHWYHLLVCYNRRNARNQVSNVMIQRYHVMSFEGDESAPHEQSFKVVVCVVWCCAIKSVKRLNASSTATSLTVYFRRL